MSEQLLETFTTWARQVAAREDVPRGIRSAAAGLYADGKRVLATPQPLPTGPVEAQEQPAGEAPVDRFPEFDAAVEAYGDACELPRDHHQKMRTHALLWHEFLKFAARPQAASLPTGPREGEPTYDDLWNALHRIDTAVWSNPEAKVLHDGGFDAFVQNIVENILASPRRPQSVER